MNMKCNKETETSFYHLDWILGKCKNNCSITDLKSCISKHYQPKQGEENFLSSYVFEKVMTNYYNEQSKVCFYDRVTRVDKKSTLFAIIDQLQHLAQKYLVHRFMVSNDTYYWKNFIQNNPFHVLTEKFQVQSDDYSGKQQTLHNTVLHSPNNKTTKYIRRYKP